jgi:hypothetical protein
LSTGFPEITTKDECQRHCRVWCHGYAEYVSPLCAWRQTMPSKYTNGCFSNTFVGITLFVSTQGCGRPQEADGQKVDTHVFRCVEW